MSELGEVTSLLLENLNTWAKRGSLWIRTDGAPGGPCVDGGKRGDGEAGKHNVLGFRGLMGLLRPVATSLGQKPLRAVTCVVPTPHVDLEYPSVLKFLCRELGLFHGDELEPRVRFAGHSHNSLAAAANVHGLSEEELDRRVVMRYNMHCAPRERPPPRAKKGTADLAP